MSKRDEDLLVDDILQAMQAIIQYTAGMSYEDFCNSQITIDATIRNFEICGEASNYLDEEFKSTHPEN